MIPITEYIKKDREERRNHLDLSESCLERGGNSTIHKGVLAQYLMTTIPSGRILLCHACHNGNCSNPKHLYWGTDKDNWQDAKDNGTYKTIWERAVEKYGLEVATEINKKNGHQAGNTRGKVNKGVPKSEEQKRKISESVSKLHKDGKYKEVKSGRKKKNAGVC